MPHLSPKYWLFFYMLINLIFISTLIKINFMIHIHQIKPLNQMNQPNNYSSTMKWSL